MALRGEGWLFVAATIGEWRGHDVAVAQGHKIGGLEAVYVDTRTGLPSFGTVTAGMPGRHRLVLVPVDPGNRGSGVPQVCYDTKQVKDAPPGGTDGELPAAGEEAIFSTTA